MDLKEGTHIQEQAIYTVKNLENCDWKIVGVCYVDEMITEKVSSAVSRLLSSCVWLWEQSFFSDGHFQNCSQHR